MNTRNKMINFIVVVILRKKERVKLVYLSTYMQFILFPRISTLLTKQGQLCLLEVKLTW